MTISVVVLTFNSSAGIEDTLAAARRVSDDIHVVDSCSTDDTVEIARRNGAAVVQRTFADYADQRNWAIQNLPLKHSWQLHLDADEIMSDELVVEILTYAANWPEDVDGFFIPRLVKFLGGFLRHGDYYPNYHMRLFRTGHATVEERKYDQHFLLTGRWKILNGPLVDDHRMPLTEWIARHNRWTDMEVAELLAPREGTRVKPDKRGNPPETRRHMKLSYYRMPLFWRAFGVFIYRYFIKAGFLDGKPGFIYCILQAFWCRFLIDAKLYEDQLHKVRASKARPAEE